MAANAAKSAPEVAAIQIGKFELLFAPAELDQSCLPASGRESVRHGAPGRCVQLSGRRRGKQQQTRCCPLIWRPPDAAKKYALALESLQQ